ncbi:MAG: GDSL-type esterase/lipase family protein [Verrucomicrobiota bacterium]
MKRVLIFCVMVMSAVSVRAAEVEVINAGVGGNSTRNLLKRVEADVLAKKPEVVVMMVGTNDALNSGNSVPIKEYEKNLKQLVKRFTKSGSKVVLMTIPPCINELLFSRHKAEFFAERSPEDRIADVNDVVKKLAKPDGVRLVDVHVLLEKGGAGSEKSSLLRNVANSRSKDGVHPTSEGYDVIAQAVYETLKAAKWDAGTIVCFGDSITYGASMKGAGTADADAQTYPAKLARLLKTE